MTGPNPESFGQSALVIGGIRSGKSDFAESLAAMAARQGERIVYMATGEASDDEMISRIALHKERRPAAWQTLEVGEGLYDAVRAGEPGTALLIDSTGEWISRLILSRWERMERAQVEGEVNAAMDRLVEAACGCRARIIFVSHEVGEGAVPLYPMGRVFCDANGLLNQRLARIVSNVWKIHAGIPVRLK